MARELAPAEHARIRRHLALIPAYICLVWCWIDLLSRLPIGPGSEAHLVRDFAAIAYVPGLIANQHDVHALYDVDRRSAMLAELLPSAPHVRYPPFYGPQMSVLFSPLARLPYGVALAVWMAITLVTYLGCAYLIWKVCPRLRDRAGTIFLVLLADPTLYYALSFVQISAIALACGTGGFLALRANRPFLAGMFIGSLIYKPSLGVAFGIVLVCAALAGLARPKLARDPSERRLVLGAIAGAAAQLAVGALFWGPSVLVDYVRAQLRLIPDMRDEFYLHHVHSWRGFFEILGLPDAVAQTAYVIAASLVLAVALRGWRSGGPLAVRYAVLLVATVLVNPHGYVYDSLILMPAFLLLWDWSEASRGRTVGDLVPAVPLAWLRTRSFTTTFEWLLYFCYFSPWFAIVAFVVRVQLSVPALSLLGLAAVGVLLREDRRRVQPQPG